MYPCQTAHCTAGPRSDLTPLGGMLVPVLCLTECLPLTACLPACLSLPPPSSRLSGCIQILPRALADPRPFYLSCSPPSLLDNIGIFFFLSAVSGTFVSFFPAKPIVLTTRGSRHTPHLINPNGAPISQLSRPDTPPPLQTRPVSRPSAQAFIRQRKPASRAHSLRRPRIHSRQVINPQDVFISSPLLQ